MIRGQYNSELSSQNFDLENLGILSDEELNLEEAETNMTTYTSLKDIMYMSSSVNEITLKNPLLKQAAMAYLRPLSNSSEQDNNNNNQGKCFTCGGAESGCFHCLEALVSFICGRIKDTNDEEDENKFK